MGGEEGVTPERTSREERLRSLYEAHAHRDIEGALTCLTDDVEWPDVAKGTVLIGHDALRAYWTDQFATIDPHVEPTGFAAEGDDVVVTVRQTVRTLDGALLAESTVTHTFTFHGELVAAMRVGRA